MATKQFINPRHKSRLSPEQEAIVAAEYASGVPVKEIARRWRCHRTLVSVIVRRLGGKVGRFRADKLGGKTFGRWTVIRYARATNRGVSRCSAQR